MGPGHFITPYFSPVALGLPLIGRQRVLEPEGCRDTPKRLTFELLPGISDAEQIVNLLQEFGKEYGKSECIVAFARCLASGITENNDREGLFSVVADFMLSKVVYVPDPLAAEYVRSPVQMLREYEVMDYAQGDCDDHVLLMISLLSALGIKTKVAAVRANATEGPMNHVIVMVNLRGEWADFDPCFKDNPLHQWPGERIVSP